MVIMCVLGVLCFYINTVCVLGLSDSLMNIVCVGFTGLLY